MSANLARVFPVFSVAFAVLYVLSMDNNWAMFTYLARAKEFHAFVVTAPTPRAGPAMYWYGWLATSALGAAVVAAVAYVVPAGWSRRIWPGLTWAVPLAAMLFVLFLLRGWFVRLA